MSISPFFDFSIDEFLVWVYLFLTEMQKEVFKLQKKWKPSVSTLNQENLS